MPVATAQIYLFVFLASVAVGTLAGGPLGDRIGRKYVIWGSILGVLPFTLALPYVDLFWTGILTVLIGVIMASAFSAILVYAQELIPGRVGTVGGLFFGFAFGMAGIAAAVLGPSRRPHQHRLRLQGVRAAAAARASDGVPARSRPAPRRLNLDRHCERSEAISCPGDCFGAYAPRNDS